MDQPDFRTDSQSSRILNFAFLSGSAPLLCGVDEAGRGCLAGPLFAAAVVLDPARPVSYLDDSKRLTPARREALAREIREKARAYGLGVATVKEIDTRGLDWANRIAFTRAVRDMLRRAPTLSASEFVVCIDGARPALRLGLRQVTVPGGDRTVPEIAAASILAKTARDRWVLEHMHARYPHFGFDTHKGYATRRHATALAAWGPTPYHRMSFTLPGLGQAPHSAKQEAGALSGRGAAGRRPVRGDEGP